MGILSFVPYGKNWIVTMNLEKSNQVSIIPPKYYTEHTGKLLFAKELDANGSWMIVHENGWIGAIFSTTTLKKSDIPKSNVYLQNFLYTIMRNVEPIITLKESNLMNFEPFVMVLFINNNLYEFSWNGLELKDQYLSNQKIYFWESNHYFGQDWQEKRIQLFNKLLTQPSFELPEFVIAVHKRFSEEKEKEITQLNPQNYYSNVALCQIILREQVFNYFFFDYLNLQYFNQTAIRPQKAF